VSRISFTVGVYHRRTDEGDDEWHALVPTEHAAFVSGGGEVRLRERLVERLREHLRKVEPRTQEAFQLALGTELVRVSVDAKVESGRMNGTIPLIVEPHWSSETEQRFIVYHPLRRDAWFICEDRADLPALANTYARHYWNALSQEALAELRSNGKDRLIQIAFSAEPHSLIDMLPSRRRDPRMAAAPPRADKVLRELGIDETARAAANTLRLGVPRSPYRERLAFLLAGQRPRSIAVVGPPGSGKTALLHQWIYDRLAEDQFPIHKNLDRIHHVWRLTGKRLIAGMSHFGEWEERCLSVLEDARKHRGILWIEDLHLFGRLGQSRQSERSFADFFRGPIRRGELCVIAELTKEQFARLERDAPGLAEALAIVDVPPASAADTAQLLLAEVRALEVRLPKLALHPFVPRTALELGSALFPWRARPGVAIEIVRRVAEDASARAGEVQLTPADVLDYLARTTGLAPRLLALDAALDPAEVEAAFAARVIGQAAATKAATDVILKVRSGLADPNRPINVMLFTGPTGTGKTELATAIAEYLYGGEERLIRIDMGELSGHDAVARLIGDRWNPDGLLTSRVRAQPFCVVLLDEIEKAHPQALHLLLQLFDEGRLTDAAGEVASFASAVVIMTSNLGSRNASPIGFGETRDRILADVAKAVREFFPIELFNRIDQVVPFEPLTHEVAAKVVDKELAKLLARRGLRERNTFVYAGAAVRRRAVADAFDPRYGARTVKRWLEDKIGGSLTDLLAAAPAARLRIVRLSEDTGRIVATLEPMQERAAMPGRYLLEGALDLPTSGLDDISAHAREALARISASPIVRARGEGELAYYVDELGARASALLELFDVPPARPKPRPVRAASYETDEDDEPIWDTHIVESWPRGYEARTRIGTNKVAARPVTNRDAILSGVAEALLIDRALPTLLDPDAHAVTVLLSRVGSTMSAGGLAIVAKALAGTAWFDDAAWLAAPAIVPVDAMTLTRAIPGGAFPSGLPPAVTDVAIVLRGLFVREALANDHGTWMIRAAAAEPDVVRVEVRPGAHDPKAVLAAHVAGRKELERVLEAGGKLPPNPDLLLPVTRTLTFRPPLRVGESFGIEIEDFATGWVDRGTSRDLDLAIRRAWHLGWSRR